MPLPEEGPCSAWFTWDDVLAACNSLSDADLAKIAAIDPGVQASIIAGATGIAYDLTGHRYPGECETTKTLCSPCVCRLSLCRCQPRSQIDLGSRFAISEVTEVVVAGVTLTAGTDYRVDRWRWLLRLGEGNVWPRCTDVEDPDGFHATWTYGRYPSASILRGVALFASEMAKKCAGLKCEIPQRVTTIVREGVTYTIIDSMKMLDEGKTGFYPLDAAIAADKIGRKVRPGMFDPDSCTTRAAVDTG